MAESVISALLRKNETTLLNSWLGEQEKASRGRNLGTASELRNSSREFLELLQQALAKDDSGDLDKDPWREMRFFLESLSASRAKLGCSPSETATFVFALKQAIFQQLRSSPSGQENNIETAWQVTVLLDRLGLYTTEVHQRTREEIIRQQQHEMLELSTPVVTLWTNVLALPIIGTLDSSRAQTIMESLLQKIVETGAEMTIIDITGVPTVDTITAQHLLKTVTAARLMGAECIISGIRPQIAQTIVQLGIDLGDVITKASLADAFREALSRTGLAVGKRVNSPQTDGDGRRYHPQSGR